MKNYNACLAFSPLLVEDVAFQDHHSVQLIWKLFDIHWAHEEQVDRVLGFLEDPADGLSDGRRQVVFRLLAK